MLNGLSLEGATGFQSTCEVYVTGSMAWMLKMFANKPQQFLKGPKGFLQIAMFWE